MNKENKLYSSGDFAKLAGVNKRTIHYYNDIGLLCPEEIGVNGYHYYTVSQFAKLQIILTFRQIGVSIDEIKTYFNNYSDESFYKILLKQKIMVNKTIDQLLQTKNFLSIKARKIELAKYAEDGKIELCTLPKRNIILSSPIPNEKLSDEEKYFSHASDFLLYLKEKFHIFDSFGTRISKENIKNKKFDIYDRYFAYSTDDKVESDLILEKGSYIRGFCIGNWQKLPSLYEKIIDFAEKHNFTLSDYFYEEGLNDLSFKSENEYITMITTKVVP